jgi:hypothetical protein
VVDHVPRVCARVRGGIGNQLFVYASARAFALRNGAELWLDTQSAFARDPDREYRLDKFAIAARVAPSGTFFVSTPPYRRTPIRFASRLLPYRRRSYIEQPWLQFVPEMLTLKVRADVYLDGYWQSEEYFRGYEDTVRRELVFRDPPDAGTGALLARIRSATAVGVHCRRTDNPVYLNEGYYQAAAAIVAARVHDPEFFVFSDDPAWSSATLRLPGPTVHIRRDNVGAHDCDDLRLMSACRHFITANSTFSWWAAWLGATPSSLIVTPAPYDMWGFATRLPAAWTQVAWR